MPDLKYINNSNVPLALAVFLATDTYDHEEGVLSATSLIKPVRQLVLDARIKRMPDFQEPLQDLSGLLASRMGSAIHDAIERSWIHSPQTALKSLGYPDRVIDRVRINPTDAEPNTIPIYLEQRAYKTVGKHKVSGKFDFVGEGMVQDFKSTGVFTFISQTNTDKYILQGSIYRWLNPDLITKDVMQIHFIFTDWNKLDALRNPKYPQSRTVSQKLQLLSYDQTDTYIKRKLQMIDELQDAPDEDIPDCTDEDLWRSAPTWKYYTDPKKLTRAAKVFDDKSEAYAHLAAKGKGIIKEFKGLAKACRYCHAALICGQRERLSVVGDLA